MIKPLRWGLINAAFFACLWFGLNGYSEGAYNVAMFAVWFTIIVSFALLEPKVIDSSKNDFSVPQWLDVCFDLCCMTLLVFHGYIFTGAMYAVHIAIINNARNIIESRDSGDVEGV